MKRAPSCEGGAFNPIHRYDPEIDKIASHGRVSMTNWVAEELAHLVKRGVAVHCKE